MKRVALVLVALLATAACGNDRAATPTTSTAPATLRVFAASSLTEAFTDLGKTFEADHPNVKVTFNFAASSALVQQLAQGAPADVVATADDANMQKLTDAKQAIDPTVVARNRLAILVGKGNPKGITGLAGLAKPGVVFVLCAPEVPCGKFAKLALTTAGVTARPASLEENVKAVVATVTLGEADAGIVYATDVKAATQAGNAQGVDIDPAIAGDPTFEASYPMATVATSTQRQLARTWIDFVSSARAQVTLQRFGFLPPAT